MGSDDELYTMHAVDDVSGDLITFTDGQSQGETISLWDDPEDEVGFIGMRILYRLYGGEWRLRNLSAAEHDARMAKLNATFKAAVSTGEGVNDDEQ